MDRGPRAVETLNGEIVYAHHAHPHFHQVGGPLLCKVDIILVELGFKKEGTIVGLHENPFMIL